MTTTVTLVTHSWPTKVTTVDNYDIPASEGISERGIYHAESEIVPPNTTRQLYITNTRRLELEELPLVSS